MAQTLGWKETLFAADAQYLEQDLPFPADTLSMQHGYDSLTQQVSAFFSHPLDPLPEKICAECGSAKEVQACAQCKQTFYCNSTCKRNHWRRPEGHKSKCKKP